jgi:hypothetical protein
LAAPSTGGAVTLTLRLSACRPTIMFLEDRGWRETLNRMPRWFSRIDNLGSVLLIM